MEINADFIKILEGIRQDNRKRSNLNEPEDYQHIPREKSIKNSILESLKEYPELENESDSEKQLLFQNSQLNKELGPNGTHSNDIVIEDIDQKQNIKQIFETGVTLNRKNNETVRGNTDNVFNERLEKLFLKSVEHEHKDIFFEKNRIKNNNIEK